MNSCPYVRFRCFALELTFSFQISYAISPLICFSVVAALKASQAIASS
jgi:hypothetical protein